MIFKDNILSACTGKRALLEIPRAHSSAGYHHHPLLHSDHFSIDMLQRRSTTTDEAMRLTQEQPSIQRKFRAFHPRGDLKWSRAGMSITASGSHRRRRCRRLMFHMHGCLIPLAAQIHFLSRAIAFHLRSIILGRPVRGARLGDPFQAVQNSPDNGPYIPSISSTGNPVVSH